MKDAFSRIGTDSKELYDYLEGDHSRVMEWSTKEISNVARMASAINDVYPVQKQFRGSFDHEAVDRAVEALRMFDPSENPAFEEHLSFAKGFNALDTAVKGNDAKGVRAASRNLLNALEKQNGADYINEIDAGNIEDPLVSEMLKGLRGMLNQVDNGSAAAKDSKAVYDAFIERASDSVADYNEMFEDRGDKRFETPFDLLRKFESTGFNYKKLI